MSSADVVAVALIVFVPTVLVARAMVRRSRGERFTNDELTTVVGVVTVGTVLLVLTRRPDVLRWGLPVGMIVFGLALVILQARGERNDWRRFIGYGAVVVGIGWIVVAIVRATSGT
jgi:FtsH-binding integral membrane protein